ncbi:MAG: ATP-binding cassette domain-containing protein [Bacteroidales bacterium]
MSEKLINLLLSLIAFICRSGNKEFEKLSAFYIEQLFVRQLGPKITRELISRFQDSVDSYKRSSGPFDYRRICIEINGETPKSQRLVFLNNIFEFLNYIKKNDIIHTSDSATFNLVHAISNELRISDQTFFNCKKFAAEEYYDITDRNNLIYVKSEDPRIANAKFIPVDDLSGYFIFYNFEEIPIVFFRYYGANSITLNSQVIFSRKTYSFRSGSILAKQDRIILYYSDIMSKIRETEGLLNIELRLSNVEFRYPNSVFGVSNVSFEVNSGEIVGVMGGSGVGKSTLFNIINGNIAPQKGAVTLNGYDYSTGRNIVLALLGFVPQDDSLFEQLTVFENLFYVAKLSNSRLKNDELFSLVNDKLAEFGLFDIRNLQVGTSLQRFISGGQRKRLNILLEIIRNPKLLLVDEPTSGLSTSDSFKIMTLLKEQVLQGSIAIVNIHQPSSDIFRMFDRILILDEGGVMVYYGNPLEAVKHFKTHAKRIDSNIAECPVCGNIPLNDIFDIIDAKKVDELGAFTESRKRSAEDWNQIFRQEQSSYTNNSHTTELPQVTLLKPSAFFQFRVFLYRFFISKVRDKEFFFFLLVVPALLSIIIAFFSKYYTTNETGDFDYSFYQNTNIPVFFLTSVIASIFLGMILSSDSIIKDSNINKREQFLQLSRFAYLNAKVVFFLLLSILQSLIYSLISIEILRIQGITFEFWLILFLMSAIGNVLGLIVSTIFKSISAVYLVVPFLIIPQIIFCGITIPFDKINYKFSNPNFVPFVGIVSPSMWSTEALLVRQFKDNKYQQNFFETEMVVSRNRFFSHSLIPRLFQIIDSAKRSSNVTKTFLTQVKQVKSGLIQLGAPSEIMNDVERIEKGTTLNFEDVESYLDSKSRSSLRIYTKFQHLHDSIANELIGSYGSPDALVKLRNDYTNKGVESLALARKDLVFLEVIGDELIQKVDPIYRIPLSQFGQAHFMSPYKRIGNTLFDTYMYNVIALVFMVLLLYLILVTDALSRFIDFVRYLRAKIFRSR